MHFFLYFHLTSPSTDYFPIKIKQKQPLDVFWMCHWMCSNKKCVLENTQNFLENTPYFFGRSQLKLAFKIIQKYFLKKLIFSNIATTVLKNELFTGVIQGFWLQLLDHLFCGVALIGCFILKSFFVKLVAFEVTAKQFSKNNRSEICDQNHQKIHVNKFIFSKARCPQLFQ